MPSEAKDLDILRKEYRNMEMNRKSFAEESNSILLKQQQSLEKLRTENENLKTDVATLQARTTMKPLNSFERSQLDKLTLEIERYKHSIESERSTIAAIEKQMTLLKEKIWNQRKLMGGQNAAAENQRTVEKQVRILENRLDQALVKFNKSLANNRRLRDDIDNLRGERVAFESVYKKLEKGLQERKRQMAQVIEQSNLSYEQRDRSRMEILAIEQANRKEQELFDRQMEEMGKKVEEEIKAANERRKSLKPQDVVSQEESKLAAEKATKDNAMRKEQEALMKQRKEKIQHFKEAFRNIATSTGISDVDQLVKNFITNHEQNFSLFTYANEQSNEIESIEEQIQDLQKQRANFTDDNDKENQYDSTLKEIEAKIDAASVQTDKYDKKCDESLAMLESLTAAIKLMVTRLDYTDDSIGEVSVNESNMLHFLGIIEKKVNEILHHYYRIQCHKYDENHDSRENPNQENTQLQCVLGVGPKAPMGVKTINVNPPKLLDYSSDENSMEDGKDNGCRPLALEELKSKVITRIGQKRSKAPKTDLLAGRRGTILQRRRSSLLVAEVSSSLISRGHNSITINDEVK